MFSELTNEYNERRAELKARILDAKSQVKKLTQPLSTHLLDSINSQVELLHKNQQLIEKQTKHYKQETTKLNTQTQKWVGMYDEMNSALKELGDVVNWAKLIEDDMKEVAASIAKMLSES